MRFNILFQPCMALVWAIYLTSIQKAYKSAMQDLPTPVLTRMLEDIVTAHQPPLVHGRRIKLRYAHSGGHNPPRIIVHGNQKLPGTIFQIAINATAIRN